MPGFPPLPPELSPEFKQDLEELASDWISGIEESVMSLRLKLSELPREVKQAENVRIECSMGSTLEITMARFEQIVCQHGRGCFLTAGSIIPTVSNPEQTLEYVAVDLEIGGHHI